MPLPNERVRRSCRARRIDEEAAAPSELYWAPEAGVEIDARDCL
jgi:hypothetical protein